MRKILIVDDDVIIRITLDKVLKNNKLIKKQAKSVNEAITSLRTEMFNLILLDLKLPPRGWEGGFEILKKKRKIALNEATPVIIISGERDEDFIQSKIDMEDNVVKIFIKPVDNDTLTKTVLQVLGLKPEE